MWRRIGALALLGLLGAWGCAGSSAAPETPTDGAVIPEEERTATDPAAAAGPRIVLAGAPGEAGRVVEAGEVVTIPLRAVLPADRLFMEQMIVHHLQAIEMSELVPDRTASDRIRLLAARIDASQDDEIRLMRRWLERHAPPEEGAIEGHAAGAHAHHEHAAGDEPHDMPGMLTQEEMALLASTSGPEFDRLFLELMIKHHEGALLMVRELFAIPGAGQEPELYEFASHVEADQAIEIGRMQRMLDELR